MKKISSTIVASLLSIAALTAQAEGYGTLSIGKADLDISGVDLDSGDSVNLGGGFKFSDYIAMELTYLNLGVMKGRIDDVDVELKTDGFNLSAVGNLPLSQQFGLYAKAGVFKWDAKASASLGAVSASESDDGYDLSFGLGAQFNIGDTGAIFLELQRFDFDGDDIDNLALGAKINF